MIKRHISLKSAIEKVFLYNLCHMSNVKTMCYTGYYHSALWQLLLFGTHVWSRSAVLMDQRVLLVHSNNKEDCTFCPNCTGCHIVCGNHSVHVPLRLGGGAGFWKFWILWEG